ncbi:MAG: metallophosphoesterase [Gammaproteobacteria bacterium]
MRIRSILTLPLLFAAALLLASGARGQTAGGGQDAWQWSGIERVVVVPDVHGAYEHLVTLLRQTGVVDDALAWSGGRTHLVSLGDLLDRGPRSRDVMDLLMRLQDEAQAAGGRVHVVLGNHEHMNLVGDLRYVATEEYAAFADDESPATRAAVRARFAAANPGMSAEELTAAFDKRYPPGYFAHRAAFRPDGRYGRWLLTLPVLIVINDTAYVHGGLPAQTADWSLAELNNTFSRDLARYLQVWRELVATGALPDDEPQSADDVISDEIVEDPSRCIEERALACEKIQGNGRTLELMKDFNRLSDAPVNGYDAPFWYRGSVYCRDILERPVLERYLATIGARRVVVGHTPTTDRRVRVIRDGRVVMTDTGMLVSYYDGKPAALVVEGGDLRVRYEEGPAAGEAPLTGFGPVVYGLEAGEFEAALRDARVTGVNRDTGADMWHVDLELGDQKFRARFFPAREGADEELAAYALDRLLGTELVPATVSRRIEDTDGALQMMWPREITEQERSASGSGFGGWCSIGEQFQLMYAFDLLIAKQRAGTHIVYDRDNWTLRLTGHGDAFGRDRKLPRGIREDAVKLPSGLEEALRALDEDAVRSALGGYLDGRRVDAILSRRDDLLRRFGD